jgi:asparagine synthase (glutamine-hydrolysing)
MCGIAGIFLKRKGVFSLPEKILGMTRAIAHRGPDGEGFALGNEKEVIPALHDALQFARQDLKYIPKVSLKEISEDLTFALGHRRLSIIDLSEAGHQPMCSNDGKRWIVFNGEVYNYPELKKELHELGYTFLTECDTEVILTAYMQWGFDCVKKFNGMWSFCIYDQERQIFFASRDRLGVKPFYYINGKDFFAFASEQKAFVKAGLISAARDEKTTHNYLVNARTESEAANFFLGVAELLPSHNLVYNTKSGEVSINKYYEIKISGANDKLPDGELISLVREKLLNSVRLRLRSDVEVGSCLSGGIDSSVLCTFMTKILDKEIFCFTSVFRDQPFNEEPFADAIARKINAKHKKTEPDGSEFFRDIDELVYSQDVPIWDSSTYAQHRVMRLAKENGIKVVLDGQGADELFAGYQHHFIAKWKNLLSHGNVPAFISDVRASRKTIESPFMFFAKENIKQRKNFNLSVTRKFFREDFIRSHEVVNPAVYFSSVNEQLLHDIHHARLKSFLKCEDRCGMWHSVESRTPFSDDVDLINFMFSFNGNRKIQNGVSKYLLREAAKPELPEKVYSRYDKRGFETPMRQWLSVKTPMMIDEVKAKNWNFVKLDQLNNLDPDNLNELKVLFRLFLLSRWEKVFS